MQIIAHRGASGDAPENTLAAFKLAWQQNAHGIELDVHLSRDARVMVHHDATTGRLADTDLCIADSTSDELRQLDLGRWKGAAFAAERMPLLEEVLATVPPGKRVVIEAKCGPDIAPVLAQMLSNPIYQMLDISLISFHLDTLIACQTALADRPCFFLAEKTDQSSGFDENLITLALTHGFAGLDLDYKGLSGDYAKRVQQAELRLLTWTVNEVSCLAHLQACGVEGITTDWPLRFLDALEYSATRLNRDDLN